LKNKKLKIIIILSFTVCFLILLPSTAGYIKERYISGDIGTATWIETWQARIHMLQRSGEIGSFTFKVLLANTFIAACITLVITSFFSYKRKS
jgi:hypothetical protein